MTNLFKITNENTINEIFENHKEKLICLIFSDSNTSYVYKELHLNIRKAIKRDLTKLFNNILFLIVDLSDYMITNNFYTKNINKESIPYVAYYYKNKELATITTATPDSIHKACLDILQELKKVLNKLKTNKLNTEELSKIESVPVPKIEPEVKINTELTEPNILEELKEGAKEAEAKESEDLEAKKMEKIKELRDIALIKEVNKIIEMKENDQ